MPTSLPQRSRFTFGKSAMYISLVSLFLLFLWIIRSQKKAVLIEFEPIESTINPTNLHSEDGVSGMNSLEENVVANPELPASKHIETDAPTTSPTFTPFTGSVFVIGFQNVGTPSTINFFEENDIQIVHNDTLPWYRLAVDQYPGSKFILQICSINEWLRSRFIQITPADEAQNILILKSWREEWYHYMCDVLHFFRFERAESPSDLLIFDVEQDDAQKIVDFAAGFGMDLNEKEFSDIQYLRLADSDSEKWNLITEKETTFKEQDQFGSETERIFAHCLLRSYEDSEMCSETV